MTIVFSGGGTAGHFYPAKNIADALVALQPDLKPYFVGGRGRIEARELPGTGYPHRLLPMAGLKHSARASQNSGGLAALASRALGDGWALALLLAATLRLLPDFRRREALAVVLTGGYVCAPAGLAARIMGLPIVLQEQNTHPGRATRFLARWARRIHVAYPEVQAVLPARARPRVRSTGNPIRPLPPEAERSPTNARAHLGLPADGRVVMVVGGSQGADALNRVVLDALLGGSPGPGDAVLWVTGPAHHESMDRALAGVKRDRVVLVPYLAPEEMDRALAASDLVVSRAGAMATSEFLAWGLPAILVPLPTAVGDHQSSNARALEAAGAALHVPERDASGQLLAGARLWERVTRLLDAPGTRARMRRAALGRARPDAAHAIAAQLADMLGRPVSVSTGSGP